MSRQALTAIEAGRQVPSTGLALQLGRALDCSVEELFSLSSEDMVDVEVVGAGEGEAPFSARMTMGLVRGRWVGHQLLKAQTAADGILLDRKEEGLLTRAEQGPGSRDVRSRAFEPATRTARLLDEAAAVSSNVLMAGCAPLIGALSGMAARRYRDVRVRWLNANSRRSLDLLEKDLVHIAGIHLLDDVSGEYNAPFVRRQFAGKDMFVVNLTRWRQGILVEGGNPLCLRSVEDLLRPDLKVARREEGAGATRLLQRMLGEEAVSLPRGPLGRSHDDIAQLVASGAADAGIAIESVAIANGLGFVPLSEECFDLVVRKEIMAERMVDRVLDMLQDTTFRIETSLVPGYDTTISGKVRAVS